MAPKMDRMLNADKILNVFRKYSKWNNAKTLFTDPAKLKYSGPLLVLVELVINFLIIERVPYTEIDWKAYMQECEGFLNGTLDYSLLKGDTGPLVYPAGFVYIYSAFYYLTDHGRYVRIAQYMFLVIYLLQLVLVLRIYVKTLKIPPYLLIVSILTSYRIHSIYVLRLFNDPIAVLLMFASLNFFIDSRRTLGSIFYSLAVSVKMNTLLYAPALLLFYLSNFGMKETIRQLFYCAAIQIALGLPFLIVNPMAYLKGSFDIGRVFNHTWTVNYRFLDEELFVNRNFHIVLLVAHLILLGVFFSTTAKYFESFCNLKAVQQQMQPQIDAKNEETKANALAKSKRALKKRQKKEATEIKKEEVLTSEQELFLRSFEKSIKGNSDKSKKIEKIEKPSEMQHYHVNFDRTNQLFILPMFLCNFIGIVCSRSLHYQFYSWYFHTLPYLIWYTPYSNIMKFLLLALIELCWNTYPSTVFSSLLLHVCHISTLIGIYKTATVKVSTS